MPGLLIPLLAALAASAAGASAPPPGPPPGARVFISPVGEPFRRGDGPGEPIDRWFAGADANHDRALTVAEAEADATRFFATLDTNHDGEIAPDEMTRYETEVAPEARYAQRLDPRRGNRDRNDGVRGLLDFLQPVSSADLDFNRGVTLAELRYAASRRFVLLDRNHDGRIPRAELEPPEPESGRRR